MPIQPNKAAKARQFLHEQLPVRTSTFAGKVRRCDDMKEEFRAGLDTAGKFRPNTFSGFEVDLTLAVAKQ